MDKRVPITIKLSPALLARLDKFQGSLPFTPTRTSLIEAAIEQMLDREEAKAKRK